MKGILVKGLPKLPIEKMNEVHSKELEILNNLYEALQKDKPNEEIDKLVNALVEDAKNHFSFEEELMEKTRFFAYHIHREEHRKMLEEINRIKEI